MENKHLKVSKYLNKSTIISAIIGIILTFFFTKVLEPICEFIYSSMLKIGDNIIISFSNSTYQAIAEGFSEQSTYTLFYMVILVLFTVSGYFCSWISALHKESQKQSEFLEKKINAPERIQPPILPTKSSFTSSDDVNNIIGRIHRNRRKNKILYNIIIAVIFFTNFSAFFMYSRQVFIREKIISAINSIEIVSPYISDQEYKEFKSAFYLIQNKQDYESLLGDLNAIADINNITLPK